MYSSDLTCHLGQCHGGSLRLSSTTVDNATRKRMKRLTRSIHFLAIGAATTKVLAPIPMDTLGYFDWLKTSPPSRPRSLNHTHPRSREIFRHETSCYFFSRKKKSKKSQSPYRGRGIVVITGIPRGYAPNLSPSCPSQHSRFQYPMHVYSAS